MHHFPTNRIRTCARALIAIAVTLLSEGLSAQTGALDLTFNPTDAGNGRNDGMRIANAVNDAFASHAAVMPDGRMVIGGNFNVHDTRTRQMLTRVMPDGSIDTTFVPGALGAAVNAVLIQPDGKVIIGGGFGSVGGVLRRGVARLNTDGSLDTGFGVGQGFQSGTSNGSVQHLLLQPDGKVIVAGGFNTFNGASVSNLVRLNADGTLDATLNTGTGFSNLISDIALQTDGKILVAGWFTTFNGTARPGIARLQSSGALDTGFAPTLGGGTQCDAMALRADGKVWLTGNFSTVNGQARQKFVLLTETGATDPGFVPATLAFNGVNTLAAQADGKLLVGIHLNNPRGEARDHLARFNADGSIDPVFAGVDFDDNVSHLLLLADQRIVVLGEFESYGTRGECIFTRLMPDGSVDPTWAQANAFDLAVYNTLAQPDGKLIVVGGFLSYFDRTANRVARLHPDGQVDETFNAWWGINSLVKDVVQQPDGKLIIGGHFVRASDPTYSSRVMRLNSDGSYDNTFVTVWNQISPTNRLALQPDGKVLAMSLQGLSRLLPNGSLDPSFIQGVSNGSLYDVLYLSSGKILVASGTTLYNGETVGTLFRLNSDGSLDHSFNMGSGPDNNSAILDLEYLPDGRILAAGSHFASFNGHPVPRLVRLYDTGDVDPTFNIGTGFDGSVSLVKVDPSGRIYASGSFLNVNGTARSGLARLLVNGTLDTTYDLGTGLGSPATGMVFTATGDMMMVGGFTKVDGVGRNRIARIKDTPRIAVNLLLEGPYNGTIMNAALRTLPGFPRTEPFTAMGYAENGFSSGATISSSVLSTSSSNAIVDWVIMEMRPAATPNVVAASRAVLLRRNGNVVDLDGMSNVGFAGLEAGSYCVAVRSRNHLPVMSSPSTPINYGSTTPVVNFTLPSTAVYSADARKNVNGVMVLAAGDVTFNGTVQYSGSGNDRDPILTRIGATVPTGTVSGYWREDVNMDGVVKYTGTNNDRDVVLNSVGGAVPTNTRVATLP